MDSNINKYNTKPKLQENALNLENNVVPQNHGVRETFAAIENKSTIGRSAIISAWAISPDSLNWMGRTTNALFLTADTRIFEREDKELWPTLTCYHRRSDNYVFVTPPLFVEQLNQYFPGGRHYWYLIWRAAAVWQIVWWYWVLSENLLRWLQQHW